MILKPFYWQISRTKPVNVSAHPLHSLPAGFRIRIHLIRIWIQHFICKLFLFVGILGNIIMIYLGEFFSKWCIDVSIDGFCTIWNKFFRHFLGWKGLAYSYWRRVPLLTMNFFINKPRDILVKRNVLTLKKMRQIWIGKLVIVVDYLTMNSLAGSLSFSAVYLNRFSPHPVFAAFYLFTDKCVCFTYVFFKL